MIWKFGKIFLYPSIGLVMLAYVSAYSLLNCIVLTSQNHSSVKV